MTPVKIFLLLYIIVCMFMFICIAVYELINKIKRRISNEQQFINRKNSE